ncbi:MAG: DJ-1/PfpI family protein [Ignavibacteriaceae bacterium]|nr:DJ-1/PfpI family protein [Ignavibacteriaceae bacterium]
MNNNSILYFLPARYFNEEEFFITKGVLEKNNYKSFTASDARDMCEGSNGKKFKADLRLENINANNFSGFVLIGGYGAKDYKNNFRLHKVLNDFNNSGKIIAAICIAPLILAAAGLLTGKSATCYPDVKQDLIKPDIDYKDLPVVITKNIITANSPKASFEFAESILLLLNKQKR